MGYLTSSHIKKFVKGQSIKQLTVDERFAYLDFESGEMLRLYPTLERGKLTIIATPFKSNGEVKQSTEIE